MGLQFLCNALTGPFDLLQPVVGPEYWRLRLGIGRPPRGGDVRAFVLGEPNAEEQRAMTEAIERGRKGLAHLLCEEVDQAHLAVQGINPAQGTA